MAIRNWGGGGELSGLFGSLIDSFMADVEASKNRAIRQAEEDAAAEDAELYDKWVNGLIEDDDWLAHVSKRIEENKGDPEKLQKWTQTFREHSDAINDGRMESAYQHGDITIHELITHYQTRMRAVETASPEYRELSDRYFNIVDQRDGAHIDEQAAIIVDKIERGRASYSDLLKFYEKMDKSLRSSSPLKAQVRRQILNIKQIVDGVTGRSGGGSGGGGGRGGGGSGGGGGSADAPSVIARANELVTELWNSGNVFVPTGNQVIPSVFDLFDVDNNMKAIKEAMADDSKAIEYTMNRWKDNPSDPLLHTPWGTTMQNTPENRWQIANQARANYDMRIQVAVAEGNSGDIIAIAGYRDKFVEDIMQFDNAQSQEAQWVVAQEEFNQRLNLAEIMPDPIAGMNMFEQAGRKLRKTTDKFLRQNARALPEFQVDAETVEQIEFTRSVAELIENADRMAPEEILTQASMLMESRPDSFFLTEEQFTTVIGNTDGPRGSGLVGQAAARDGYQATVDIRAGREPIDRDGNYVEPWVYVAKAGETTPVLVKQSEVDSYLELEDGDWMSEVRPFAEKMGNQTTLVYRQMEELPKNMLPNGGKWYRNKNNGRYMTTKEAEKFGRDAEAMSEANYEEVDIEEMQGWRIVTDSTGRIHYVAMQDGLIYDKMPFKAGITGSFDLSELIGDDGKFQAGWIQGAQGLVMGVGPGVSPRTAQGLMMDAATAMQIDLSNYYHTDISTGQTSWESLDLDDLEGMLWSKYDQGNRMIRDSQIMHEDWAKGQRSQRYIRTRQEQRRQARVREWFDEAQSKKGRDIGLMERMPTPDPIEGGASKAGITIAGGRVMRNTEESGKRVARGAGFVAPKLPTKAQSPVTLDALRLDPKDRSVATPDTQATRPLMPAPKPAYAKSPAKKKTANSGGTGPKLF